MRSFPVSLLNRRGALRLAGAAALAGSGLAHAGAAGPIKAVAFDGFPIFDIRAVGMRAEAVFPGRGNELTLAWRTRQFEYTWLRTLMGRYADFWTVTQEALVFACAALKLELDDMRRERLMAVFLELPLWPDAAPALRKLREAGLRLVFLANLTPAMMEAGVRNNGIADLFEGLISTDRVGAYKPDPRAYQMGVDALKLPREQIAFCAFGGWDAAGAASFGYPTCWINRLGQPVEELGVKPQALGPNLEALLRFVL